MKLAIAFAALQAMFLIPFLFVYPLLIKYQPLVAFLFFQSFLNSILFSFCILFAQNSAHASATERVPTAHSPSPIIIYYRDAKPVSPVFAPKPDNFDDLDDYHSSKSTEEEESWT
jgi:hypothetical protein